MNKEGSETGLERTCPLDCFQNTFCRVTRSSPWRKDSVIKYLKKCYHNNGL